MKNNIWFIMACVLLFVVGYNMNNTAVSFGKYKVAVVDVSTILDNSGEVQQLNRENDKKNEELNILISKAQNDILNEPDKAKLLQKEANYRQQIENKKNSIDKEYADKLAKINDNIKNVVSKEAQKSGYNLVLPTGMVIVGGEDITSKVVKNIK